MTCMLHLVLCIAQLLCREDSRWQMFPFMTVSANVTVYDEVLNICTFS